MKRIFSISLFLILLIISIFLLFSDLEKAIQLRLTTKQGLSGYIILSFLFLVSDIVLPIPSSLIMILNGKILGIVAGSILSIVSGLISSSIGFYIGRKSNIFLNKFFTKKEIENSDRLFNSLGPVAISLSKALPIFSESVSILSGTFSITFKKFFVYSLVGQSIVSIIYAYVGSISGIGHSNSISGLIIILTLLIAWTFQIFIRQKTAKIKNIPKGEY